MWRILAPRRLRQLDPCCGGDCQHCTIYGEDLCKSVRLCRGQGRCGLACLLQDKYAVVVTPQSR